MLLGLLGDRDFPQILKVFRTVKNARQHILNNIQKNNNKDLYFL